MFTPAKLAVLLTAALSVAAMPSHIARTLHNHREIAARVAQPEVAPVQIAARDMSVPAQKLVRKKRSGNGRCKSSSDAVPSSTIKEGPTSSSDPATPENTPAVKGGLGGLNLHTHSSHSADPHTTPEEDPEPSTSSTDNQPDHTTPTPTPTPTSTPTPTPTSGSGSGGSGSGGGQTYTGQGTRRQLHSQAQLT